MDLGGDNVFGLYVASILYPRILGVPGKPPVEVPVPGEP